MESSEEANLNEISLSDHKENLFMVLCEPDNCKADIKRVAIELISLLSAMRNEADYNNVFQSNTSFFLVAQTIQLLIKSDESVLDSFERKDELLELINDEKNIFKKSLNANSVAAVNFLKVFDTYVQHRNDPEYECNQRLDWHECWVLVIILSEEGHIDLLEKFVSKIPMALLNCDNKKYTLGSIAASMNAKESLKAMIAQNYRIIAITNPEVSSPIICSILKDSLDTFRTMYEHYNKLLYFPDKFGKGLLRMILAAKSNRIINYLVVHNYYALKELIANENHLEGLALQAMQSEQLTVLKIILEIDQPINLVCSVFNKIALSKTVAEQLKESDEYHLFACLLFVYSKKPNNLVKNNKPAHGVVLKTLFEPTVDFTELPTMIDIKQLILQTYDLLEKLGTADNMDTTLSNYDTSSDAFSTAGGRTAENKSLSRSPLFKSQNEKNAAFEKLLLEAIPNSYEHWKAKGEGDCFFDAVAMALNGTQDAAEYSIKSLRLLCSDYARDLDQKCNADPKHPDNWIGSALKKPHDDYIDYQQYLGNIEFTAEEKNKDAGIGNDKLAIWGEQHIDGKIICEKLGIKIHIIEARENPCFEEEGGEKFMVSHNTVSTTGLKSGVAEGEIVWDDTIHLAVYNNHFVPILPKGFIEELDEYEKNGGATDINNQAFSAHTPMSQDDKGKEEEDDASSQNNSQMLEISQKSELIKLLSNNCHQLGEYLDVLREKIGDIFPEVNDEYCYLMCEMLLLEDDYTGAKRFFRKIASESIVYAKAQKKISALERHALHAVTIILKWNKEAGLEGELADGLLENKKFVRYLNRNLPFAGYSDIVAAIIYQRQIEPNTDLDSLIENAMATIERPIHETKTVSTDNRKLTLIQIQHKLLEDKNDQRHSELMSRMNELEINQNQIIPGVEKKKFWEERKQHYFFHPNKKKRAYFRTILSECCTVFYSLLISHSELLGINAQMINKMKHKIGKQKEITHGLITLTNTTELVVKISEKSVDALKFFEFLGFAALNVADSKVVGVIEHTPVLGTVASVVAKTAEYIQESKAENTIQNVGEMMRGLTPSMLENLAVEVSIQLTERYKEHIRILKNSEKGVVLFGKCGATRILICLLNCELNHKKGFTEQLLEFIRTKEIKQWRKIINKNIIRIDIHKSTHQPLEVTDSYQKIITNHYIEAEMTEDFLYRHEVPTSHKIEKKSSATTIPAFAKRKPTFFKAGQSHMTSSNTADNSSKNNDNLVPDLSMQKRLAKLEEENTVLKDFIGKMMAAAKDVDGDKKNNNMSKGERFFEKLFDLAKNHSMVKKSQDAHVPRSGK